MCVITVGIGGRVVIKYIFIGEIHQAKWAMKEATEQVMNISWGQTLSCGRPQTTVGVGSCHLNCCIGILFVIIIGHDIDFIE